MLAFRPTLRAHLTLGKQCKHRTGAMGTESAIPRSVPETRMRALLRKVSDVPNSNSLPQDHPADPNQTEYSAIFGRNAGDRRLPAGNRKELIMKLRNPLPARFLVIVAATTPTSCLLNTASAQSPANRPAYPPTASLPSLPSLPATTQLGNPQPASQAQTLLPPDFREVQPEGQNHPSRQRPSDRAETVRGVGQPPQAGSGAFAPNSHLQPTNHGPQSSGTASLPQQAAMSVQQPHIASQRGGLPASPSLGRSRENVAQNFPGQARGAANQASQFGLNQAHSAQQRNRYREATGYSGASNPTSPAMRANRPPLPQTAAYQPTEPPLYNATTNALSGPAVNAAAGYPQATTPAVSYPSQQAMEQRQYLAAPNPRAPYGNPTYGNSTRSPLPPPTGSETMSAVGSLPVPQFERPDASGRPYGSPTQPLTTGYPASVNPQSMPGPYGVPATTASNPGLPSNDRTMLSSYPLPASPTMQTQMQTTSPNPYHTNTYEGSPAVQQYNAPEPTTEAPETKRPWWKPKWLSRDKSNNQ